MAIVCINFQITMLVTVVAVEILKTGTYLATAFSIVCTVGLTYVTGKIWIFRQREAV